MGDKVLVTYRRSQNDPEDIKRFAIKGDFLLKVSVSNVGDKVIIHPDILKYATEQELLQILLDTRQNYCYHIDLCKEMTKQQKKLSDLRSFFNN